MLQQKASRLEGDKLGATAWYCVLVLTLGYVVNYLDRGILVILIERIKADLRLSDTMIGLMTGPAFTLVYGIAGIPLARLADRSSRRNIIAISMLVWSAMTAIGGLAQSGIQLLLARTVVALGEAGGYAASQAYVADLVPRRKRAQAIAVLMVGSPIGTFIGLAIGGLIAHHYSWRITLFAAGMPGIFVVALMLMTLDHGNRRVTHEAVSAAKRRLVTKSLLKKPSILFAMAGSVCYSITFSSFQTWGAPLMSRVHHLDIATIGLLLGTANILAAVSGGIIGGWFVSRYGRDDIRWNAMVPAFLSLATLPSYLVYIHATSVPVAMTGALFGMFFQTASLGTIVSIFQVVAPPSVRAFIASFYVLINSVGIGAGPLLIGLLNDRWHASMGSTAIQSSMTIAAFFLVPACLLLWLASRTIRRDAEAMEVLESDVSPVSYPTTAKAPA